MNAQLQAQLSQVIAQIMLSVGEVKDFSIKELPDIAQQYITYGIWSSAISTAIFATIIIIALIFAYKIYRYARNIDDEFYPVLILPGLVILFASAPFLVNLRNLILVLTAPKVWFILEIKNLLS
jgi:hypothetical protein